MAAFVMDPFRQMAHLRREIERAFDGFTEGRTPYFHTAFLPGRGSRQYPLLNVNEDKDNLYVEALAPGLDTGSIEVSVVRGTLRIAGEKSALSETIKPEQFHRNERAAGRFVRTITLPTEVDSAKVSASYQNGLLRIVLPKAEAAKPRRIDVTVS